MDAGHGSDVILPRMNSMVYLIIKAINLQVHLLHFAVSTQNFRGIEMPVENICCVNTNM